MHNILLLPDLNLKHRPLQYDEISEVGEATFVLGDNGLDLLLTRVMRPLHMLYTHACKYFVY